MLYAWPIDSNVLKQLIPSKDIANHTDMSGRAAICIACDRKDLAAFKVLLEQGADPNFIDNQGFTIVTRLWN